MRRILVSLLVIVLAVLAVGKVLLFELPRVEGDDMAPVLQRGDWLLANKLRRTPERGQLVLMEHPQHRHLLIRRVVGLPGERVKVRRDRLYIDGKQVEQRRLREVTLTHGVQGTRKVLTLVEEHIGLLRYRILKDSRLRATDGPEVVLKDAFYVLADNRAHGRDSRTFGLVPKSRIRAIIGYRLSAGEGSFLDPEEREGLQAIEP